MAEQGDELRDRMPSGIIAQAVQRAVPVQKKAKV